MIFLPSILLPAGILYFQMYLFNHYPQKDFRALTYLTVLSVLAALTVISFGTNPEGEFGNFVRQGSLEITNALIARGMSPQDAKSLSNARIFGGVNGNFGTGAMGAAQDTGKWEDTKGIAELYLNNMGAVYTEGHWGRT